MRVGVVFVAPFFFLILPFGNYRLLSVYFGMLLTPPFYIYSFILPIKYFLDDSFCFS